MEEYIKWLEDTLEEALEEVEYAYKSAGAQSRWANGVKKEFKQKKEQYNSKNN